MAAASACPVTRTKAALSALPTIVQAWVATAADQATDAARDAGRKARKMLAHLGRVLLWEFWLSLWQSWVKSTAWRARVGEALGWREIVDGARLENMLLAVDQADREPRGQGASDEGGRIILDDRREKGLREGD